MPIPWGIFGVTKERKERFQEDLRRVKAGLPLTDNIEGDNLSSTTHEKELNFWINSIRSRPLKYKSSDSPEFEKDWTLSIFEYSYTCPEENIAAIIKYIIQHSMSGATEEIANNMYVKPFLSQVRILKKSKEVQWSGFNLCFSAMGLGISYKKEYEIIKGYLDIFPPGNINRNVIEIALRHPKDFGPILHDQLMKNVLPFFKANNLHFE